MTQLDRYLVREVGITLVGALAVILLALIGGALFEILAPLLAKGANPFTVGQYLAFRVPWAIVFGLPLAFLFSLLLVFSRMSEDSELKAMLAGGVSKFRVLLPMLGLGVVLFCIAIIANETLVPKSLQLGQSRLRQAVFDKPRALLTPGQILTDKYGRKLYVGKVGTSQLEDLRVVTTDEIVTAKTGSFKDGNLVLNQGQRITYSGSRPRSIATFKTGKIPLVELGFDPPSPLANLSLVELKTRVKQYRSQKLPYHAELTALERKYAEPASVFSFALFAVGIAFYLLGASRNLGLVGVVVITFVYYATWSVGRIMGEQGTLNPLIAAWGPNVLYALGGLWLLLAKRR